MSPAGPENLGPKSTPDSAPADPAAGWPVRPGRARLLGLLLVLLVSVCWAAANWYDLRTLFGAPPAVRAPLALRPYSNQVLLVADEWRTLLQPGDRIAALDGEPYRHKANLGSMLYRKQPGDQMAITLADGRQISLPLRAYGLEQNLLSAAARWFRLTLLPLLCFVVALWVLLARPTDARAWLVAWVLLSFACSFASSASPASRLPSPWRLPAYLVVLSLARSWPVAMLMLGLHFPQKSPLEEKLPVVGWLFGWLQGALLLLTVVASAGDLEGIGSLEPLHRLLEPLQGLLNSSAFFTVALFFAAISSNLRRLPQGDAKRRIKLFVFGLQACLTPVFLLFLLNNFTSIPVPDPLWNFAYLLMLGTPFVFGYTIIVARALDVRIALRQGLQYALASKGLVVIQMLLAGLITWAVSALAQREEAEGNFGLQVVVVASGLLAGTLLLRGGDRLRQAIDRRFFREQLRTDMLLSELSNEVRGVVDEQQLLALVRQRLAETLHVDSVEMLLPADRLLPQTAQRAAQPLQIFWEQPPAWLADYPAEASALKDMRAQLLLPLAVRGGQPGLFILGPRRSEQPYSRSDVKLLEPVATQVALAIDNARLTHTIAEEIAARQRQTRELEIAREVQEKLFPQRRPEVPGVDFLGHCRPALQIGGDYFDYVALPAAHGGGLGLAIGDVAGKGVPAALLMASLQASLRSQVAAGAQDLSLMMEQLNRLLYDASPGNRYATFFYANYQPQTRLLQYVNAGHNAPFLLRAGQVMRLTIGGPCVGLLPVARFETGRIPLQPGDLLVGFTDGISEAENAAQAEFGEEALLAVLQAHQHLPLEALVQQIMAATDGFVAGAPQHDDMTILVARFG